MPFIELFNQFIHSGEDLPTLPNVVIRLQETFGDENAGAAQIADIIEHDPALTARLLRVANSAFYSSGDQAVSVFQAIQRLGLSEVKAACTLLAVVRIFSEGKGGLEHRILWEHSVAVGATARRLWWHLSPSTSAQSDELYVAGLLHDVGLLVLDQFFPEYFQKTLRLQQKSGKPLWECENRMLGMNHGDIGGVILGHWSISKLVSEIVGAHHSVKNKPKAHLTAWQVLRSADAFCSDIGIGVAEVGKTDLSKEDVLKDAGVAEDDIQTLLTELQDAVSRSKNFLVGI